MPASGVSFLKMPRAAALAAPLSGFAESLTRAIVPFPRPHRSIVVVLMQRIRPQNGKAFHAHRYGEMPRRLTRHRIAGPTGFYGWRGKTL